MRTTFCPVQAAAGRYTTPSSDRIYVDPKPLEGVSTGFGDLIKRSFIRPSIAHQPPIENELIEQIDGGQASKVVITAARVAVRAVPIDFLECGRAGGRSRFQAGCPFDRIEKRSRPIPGNAPPDRRTASCMPA